MCEDQKNFQFLEPTCINHEVVQKYYAPRPFDYISDQFHLFAWQSELNLTFDWRAMDICQPDWAVDCKGWREQHRIPVRISLHTLHSYEVHNNQKHNTALYRTILLCTALHCTELHCTTQHYTVLKWTTLPCIALHCTDLHSNKHCLCVWVQCIPLDQDFLRPWPTFLHAL